jgi:glycine/sarcosine N-methyltransferase
MGIYESLAPHYDDFFPQDPGATSFLLGLSGGAPTSAPASARGAAPLAVDFGCATGSQVLDLAAAGRRAVGWEPCEAMLDIARGKAASRGLAAAFEGFAMQEAAARLGPGSVDLALCLGNTLPHLGGDEELARFIADLALVASSGGIVVLQLLNYELVLRLLRAGEFGFPVLRAAGVSFERSYSLEPDGSLAFRAALVEEGRRIVEENRLRPFGRDRIVALLESSGFEGIASRGGWDRDSYDPSADRYLILTARRR